MRSSATTYRLYGLSLQSQLPLTATLAGPGHADVDLREGTRNRFERLGRLGSSRTRKPWFMHRRLPGGASYLRWSGLFSFWVSADGRQVEYRRSPGATRESFSTYLLGQVLSFSLIALGLEPLHGTVVVVDGKAVGFLGDCGYGKSTLGAAFLRLGFPVLTDDLVVLRRRGDAYAVQPGMARLKLFPRVARALLGTATGGNRLNPGTTKVILPLGPGEAAGGPVPLSALYVLGRPRRRQPTRIQLERLEGQQAFFEMIGNSFNAIVAGKDRLERQFAFATELVRRVPVKRLTYPRDLSLLPAVCDAVLGDLP